MFLLDAPTARDLLDALRLYEGRLVGSGRRLSPGAREIRCVAERSLAVLTVQPSPVGEQRADNEPMQLMTLRDVAFALQSSDSTVKRLVSSGDLTAVHVGRSVRVRPADLQQYIDDLADGAGQPTQEKTA